MDRKEKVWTRDYILVCCVSILIRFGMFTKLTMQPLYLLDIYSSKTIAGLAMTFLTISALVLRPISGRVIDKYGRKTMLLSSTILFALTTIPFGLSENLLILYSLQILNGLVFSILSVAITTMITDIVPESRLTDGLGYFGLTATIAQAFGPAIALIIINLFGFKIGFILNGLMLLSSAVFILFIVYEKMRPALRVKDVQESVGNIEKRRTGFIDKIIERNAAFPSMFIGIISIVSASISTFLIPYAQFHGIESIGFYFTARAAGVAVSRLLAGKITDIFGSFRILMIGMLCIFIGTTGINFARNILSLILIAFTYGLGYGLSSLLLNVGAVIKTPQKNRAAANATFYLAMDVGIGMGSLAWGVVGDTIGMNNIFIGSAIISLLTLIIFSSLRKSKEVFVRGN